MNPVVPLALIATLVLSAPSSAAVYAQATPAQSQTPTPSQAPPASAIAPRDAVDQAGFADEVTLTARPALILTGRTPWPELYATIRAHVERVTQIARAQGTLPAGPPMTRFVSSNDDQVEFEAILPVVALSGAPERFAPARPGTTPAGRAFRFVHLGGYDTIEQTYDEITQFIEERSLQAEDAFVEEYVRDPETTPETELATFIYVFPKP